MAALSGKARPFLRSCVRDTQSQGRGAALARCGEECRGKLREPAQSGAEFAQQLPYVLHQSTCSIPMSVTQRSRRQKNAAL